MRLGAGLVRENAREACGERVWRWEGERPCGEAGRLAGV